MPLSTIVYIVSGTGMQGGATKSFLNLLRYTVRKGNKAIVVCPDKKGLFDYIHKGNVPGAEALSLDYTYDILPFLNKPMDWAMFLPRLAKRFIKNRLAAIKLTNILRNRNISLIHSNTSVNNVGYLTASRLNIPHIWHIREYGKKDFNMIVPFQKKKLSAEGNYVISITKDILASKGIEESETARVIYNGIMEKGVERYRDEHKGYFLYAGRVTEKKGIWDLLESYLLYVKATKEGTPFSLRIAGKAEAGIIDQINKFSRDNGLTRLVVLLGPREDIDELMYGAAAVIIPSFAEGFGRVMPEAMANGALTIGRDSGGTKEQMDNGLSMTGHDIALRFNTVKDLAELLSKVASVPKAEFRPVIEQSQKVVEELYTPEKSSRNVNDFYSYILTSDL